MELDYPVKNRNEALELADTYHKIVVEECRGMNKGLFFNNVSILDILRSPIIQRAADSFQGSVTKKVSYNQFFKHRLLKSCINNLLGSKRDYHNTKINFKDMISKTLLIIPRTDKHLRDLILVCKRVNTLTGFDTLWVTFSNNHYHRVIKNGFKVLLVNDINIPTITDYIKVFFLWKRLMKLLNKIKFTPKLKSTSWSLFISSIEYSIASQLKDLWVSNKVLTHLFKAVKPKGMLIGNPNTMEGRLAGTISNINKVPTITIQHGHISELDPIWKNPKADIICVWGEQTKSALLKLDVLPSKIVQTGAPWLDEWNSKAKPNHHNQKQILVAFSGAGHMVGLDEHRSAIEKVFKASQQLIDYTFIFRLHPKDRKEYYEDIATRFPNSKVVIHKPQTMDDTIHNQLAASLLLLTISSTAAIDAMLMRVPVITLGRLDGVSSPDYVTYGATNHVPCDELLGPVIKDIVVNGQNQDKQFNANKYVQEYYTNIDGNASDEVVKVVKQLMSY
tara:strand:+ start:1626 stop:3140 length:1515 start_codon:yes stop_codon:yes gene_type:complete